MIRTETIPVQVANRLSISLIEALARLQHDEDLKQRLEHKKSELKGGGVL